MYHIHGTRRLIIRYLATNLCPIFFTALISAVSEQMSPDFQLISAVN